METEISNQPSKKARLQVDWVSMRTLNYWTLSTREVGVAVYQYIQVIAIRRLSRVPRTHWIDRRRYWKFKTPRRVNLWAVTSARLNSVQNLAARITLERALSRTKRWPLLKTTVFRTPYLRSAFQRRSSSTRSITSRRRVSRLTTMSCPTSSAKPTCTV